MQKYRWVLWNSLFRLNVSTPAYLLLGFTFVRMYIFVLSSRILYFKHNCLAIIAYSLHWQDTRFSDLTLLCSWCTVYFFRCLSFNAFYLIYRASATRLPKNYSSYVFTPTHINQWSIKSSIYLYIALIQSIISRSSVITNQNPSYCSSLSPFL